MTEQHPSEDPSIWLNSATNIVRQILDSPSSALFLAEVLPGLLRLMDATSGGLVVCKEGNWETGIWEGNRNGLPQALFNEALDQTGPLFRDGWCVSGLPQSSLSESSPLHVKAPTVIAFEVKTAPSTHRASIASYCQLVSSSYSLVDHGCERSRRMEQLQIVLHASAEWLQIDDDEALLRHIADTATELLGCERASIFLWQKRRKKLIGRPALGIEDSALEVADDAGVRRRGFAKR